MGRLIFASVMAASLATAVSARASTIYQSIPDLTVVPATNGYCSECGADGDVTGQLLTIGTAASVSDVLFAVTNTSAWPTSVTLSIYADAGGDTLGTQLYDQTYSTFASDTPTANGTDVVDVATPSLVLPAGNYDLFLSNPSDLAIPGYSAAQSQLIYIPGTTSPPGVGAQYYLEEGVNAGVELDGSPVAAPEPASIALLGVGLVGLAAIRQRRRAG